MLRALLRVRFPAHNRMAEGRFIPLLVCLYVPLCVLAGGILAAARHLLRAQRTRWTGWRAASK